MDSENNLFNYCANYNVLDCVEIIFGITLTI